MHGDKHTWEVQIKSFGHSAEKRSVYEGAIREGFKKEVACQQSVEEWLSHSHLEGRGMDPRSEHALALYSQDQDGTACCALSHLSDPH